ncbi:hypothetical protein ALI22I_31425 [Saccharothrix sp. ALI-22-I]|uniref:FxSxx-COOH system tetratricopeptide repeat protein n=1 Tax=Saccharothrix sp. ALI-22-I TaxID=1933778 RepID=UPI00097BB7DC|nr:FxSxx-COOH system tetratricopeptide repeat protein [Saccharothrix sp. ALI-22-I]ONI84968.1 hypothetical protein ALI22I_31425 [Saccharothrix sp. ALI-22-I]
MSQQATASDGATVYQAGRDIHVHVHPRRNGVARHLPPPNPNFTGRTELLAALDDVPSVLTLRGMGGVGKTQLALAYAHRVAATFDVVWWVPAEQSTLIPDHLADLGRALGLPSEDDPVAMTAVVLAALHGRRSLLVFDNADDPAAVREFLPSGGRVLITTRRAGFTALGAVLDVDVLSRSESVALLRRRVPEIAEPSAAGLAEFFGDLPLAIEQASAYLDASGLPVEDYLDLLRTRTAEMIGHGRIADRQDTLATLWDLSLAAVAEQAPAAVPLLDLLARLAPEPVPLDLFTKHSEVLPAPLAEVVTDPLAWANTVGVLVDRFLVRRAGREVTIVHRLLQQALVARSPGDRSTCQELLLADLPEKVVGTPENWPRWRALLPHVLAVCEDSSVDAMLLERAGTYLLEHGRVADAHTLLERALAALDPDGPRPIVVMNKLWSALHALGRHTDALGLAQRALALCNATPDVHADHLTMALIQLSASLQSAGRPQEARSLFDRALRIAGKNLDLGPSHMTHYGGILLAQGRYAEAVPLLERGVAATEVARGPDHLETAGVLQLLAQAHRLLGRPTSARPLLERALAIVESAYGPEHSGVVAALSAVGDVLIAVGDSIGAQPYLRRVLEITEAVYGSTHPQFGATLNSQANAWRVAGHPAKAISLHQRAAAMAEETYGPDHPVVADRIGNLGVALCDLERFAEALPLFERAVACVEAAHGPDHAELAVPLANLGAALDGLGRPAEALPVLERALRIAEAVHGPEHPAVADVLGVVGSNLFRQGRFEQARRTYARALEIKQAALGAGHPHVAGLLAQSANISFMLGKLSEARPAYERAVAIYEGAFGPEHPEVVSIRQFLALTLRAEGRSVEARTHLERALEVVGGPDDPRVAAISLYLARVLLDLDLTEEARAAHERGMAIAEAVYGEGLDNFLGGVEHLLSIRETG